MDYDPYFVYCRYFGIYGSDSTYLLYEQIFSYVYIYSLVVSIFTNVFYVSCCIILLNVCEMPVQNIVSICIRY